MTSTPVTGASVFLACDSGSDNFNTCDWITDRANSYRFSDWDTRACRYSDDIANYSYKLTNRNRYCNDYAAFNDSIHNPISRSPDDISCDWISCDNITTFDNPISRNPDISCDWISCDNITTFNNPISRNPDISCDWISCDNITTFDNPISRNPDISCDWISRDNITTFDNPISRNPDISCDWISRDNITTFDNPISRNPDISCDWISRDNITTFDNPISRNPDISCDWISAITSQPSTTPSAGGTACRNDYAAFNDSIHNPISRSPDDISCDWISCDNITTFDNPISRNPDISCDWISCDNITTFDNPISRNPDWHTRACRYSDDIANYSYKLTNRNRYCNDYAAFNDSIHNPISRSPDDISCDWISCDNITTFDNPISRSPNDIPIDRISRDNHATFDSNVTSTNNSEVFYWHTSACRYSDFEPIAANPYYTFLNCRNGDKYSSNNKFACSSIERSDACKKSIFDLDAKFTTSIDPRIYYTTINNDSRYTDPDSKYSRRYYSWTHNSTCGNEPYINQLIFRDNVTRCHHSKHAATSCSNVDAIHQPLQQWRFSQ
ncbi:tetratricopeptide repeat protein [Phytophthora cinnamomi]|uniref:tetratricopeptide repeat protein n=1 Tax=Phytophthora cinnamomi TaxID=4785 RepID=UPI00355A0216|nr:tetratricopeptide repeat protein [Phytophthora cinnamomi]